MVHKFAQFAAIALVVLLVSCGGGGSGSDGNSGITGPVAQASAGSPMSKARVVFKSLADSTSASGTADDDGAVAIPQSGLTYPAIAQAISANGNLIYYGYVASASQKNAPINPLTTLTLAIASGGNPRNITSVAQLSAAKSLSAAQSDLKSIFSNILSRYGVATNTDLLTTNLVQDHTGLDLILDSIAVNLDPSGNPVICNKLTASCRTLNLSSLNTSAIPFSDADYASLQQVPFDTCSRAIGNLTLATLTNDVALYDNQFVHSGINAAQFRSNFAQAYSGLNLKFNQPLYVGKDGFNNFLFRFSVMDVSGRHLADMVMPMKMSGARCLLAGNQLPFNIGVSSTIFKQERVDGTNNPNAVTTGADAGLYFQVSGISSSSAPYQGSEINSVTFDYCDAQNACSSLVTMTKAPSNSGFYFPSGEIPFLKYSSAGLSSNSFYNGNANPIRVTFKTANNSVVNPSIYIRPNGGYIAPDVVQGLALPSVTNVTTILSTGSNLSSPTFNFTTSAGIVVGGLRLNHGPHTAQVSGTTQMVLTSTSGSATISDSITSSTDTYRSLTLTGAVPGGLAAITVKYVWSPQCTGCT